MTKGLMAAVAAAAGLDHSEPARTPAPVSAAPSAPPAPQAPTTEEKLAGYALRTWNSSAAIRSQFRGDVLAYHSWLEAKQAGGVGISALPAELAQSLGVEFAGADFEASLSAEWARMSERERGAYCNGFSTFAAGRRYQAKLDARERERDERLFGPR